MSKRYYYIRRQSGGCDYTIGCGISIEELNATSKQEAIKEVIGLSSSWKEDMQTVFSEDNDNLEDHVSELMAESNLYSIAINENRIQKATLLEVTDKIDMMPLLEKAYQEVKEFENELLLKSQEEAERKQYEKLKKKFGK